MGAFSISSDGKLAITASETSSKSDFDYLIGNWSIDEGEFFGREVVADKDVIVKFHWDKRDLEAPIYSRAFSADAGRTWEWNWYSNFSRR